MIIGFSLGDYNGIGIEVFLKAFKDKTLLKTCTPVLFASKQIIEDYCKQSKQTCLGIFYPKTLQGLVPNQINVLDGIKLPTLPVNIGKPSIESGKTAYLSLVESVNRLKNKQIDALVTLPIDKKNILSAGFNWIGHTEFLGETFNRTNELMLMVYKKLKIGVVTGHIAVENIAKTINSQMIVDKVSILHQSLKNDFNISTPKIALLGLNPHNGDQGIMGNQEAEIIAPAIEKCKQMGYSVFGPFPGDGFFGSESYTQYDGILGMYHDQGLIPFKTISKNRGVNFTAGLPVIRCSPDHGTAFEIAGQNKATCASLQESIQLCIALHGNREQKV